MGRATEHVGEAARFAEAHRAMLADGSLQFDLTPAPPPPAAPAWLAALGRWLEHALAPLGRLFGWLGGLLPAAPYARILLWTVLAAGAAALVALLWARARGWRWRRRADVVATEPAWAPEAAQARAWLDEADALAAEGRYAEAAHHLLLRSVEDIARRRPRLVRPALTSRDLACATAIPGEARRLFAGIAATVERSLFGGGAVTVEEWSSCRDAYAGFASGRAWT